MRRTVAGLALVAAVTTPVLSAAPAEAIYCGVLHPVCQTVCYVGYVTLGAYCVD